MLHSLKGNTKILKDVWIPEPTTTPLFLYFLKMTHRWCTALQWTETHISVLGLVWISHWRTVRTILPLCRPGYNFNIFISISEWTLFPLLPFHEPSSSPPWSESELSSPFERIPSLQTRSQTPFTSLHLLLVVFLEHVSGTPSSPLHSADPLALSGHRPLTSRLTARPTPTSPLVSGRGVTKTEQISFKSSHSSTSVWSPSVIRLLSSDLITDHHLFLPKPSKIFLVYWIITQFVLFLSIFVTTETVPYKVKL